ncbi:hypothetical protein [Streptomyces sp. NPDC050145]|uniref:hypothetical protein n=1 Tax=Streptomyces sp. NPDC050145 TaxID=3365602 RepID=UPI0037A49A98
MRTRTMAGRVVRPLAGLLLASAALVGVGTGPAVAAEPPADGPATTQAERLAVELRRDPVYVAADRPREMPRSLAPQIARIAHRTGVPTYVLALPAGDETLLARVHDRLGKDGLYVLIGDHGSIDAAAFGVAAPAEEGARAALYGTPTGAGPLVSFKTFADTVALSPGRARDRADALYARYRADGRPEAYIHSVDRQNQNLLLGMAVVLVPGLVLALGIRLSRRRGTGTGRPKTTVSLAKSSGRAKSSGSAARSRSGAASGTLRRRGVLPVTAAATLGALAAVVLAAPAVFPQTVDGPDVRITRADLDARVREAGAALADGPLYQAPWTADVLTGADRTAILHRMAGLKQTGPVYLLIGASDTDDEAEGDADLLLARVHRSTGHDGVYVLFDPVTSQIDLATFGTGRDAASRFRALPDSVRYGDYRSDGDLQARQRLDQTLDAVADARPDSGYDDGEPETALPPVHDTRLPALFSSDFAPGLFLGALALGLLLPLLWLLLAATRAVRRRTADRPALAGTGDVGPEPLHTSALPSARQLRNWALTDVRELTRRLADAAQDAPGRVRAYDCLDAAGLLTAGERPDENAEAGDLAAVVILAGAGLAALDGRTGPTLCRLNPLHGEATGSRVPAWLADAGTGPRSARLCRACRQELRGDDKYGAATRRLLRLPVRGQDAPEAWDGAGAVLPAARDGIEALISRARESASVQ